MDDDLDIDEVKDSSNMIVIAEKNCFKGQLFGHISCGGGILKLSNGKSIKFIALNEKFVTLQLLESGIGTDIKTQSWRKSKQIKRGSVSKGKKGKAISKGKETEVEEI